MGKIHDWKVFAGLKSLKNGIIKTDERGEDETIVRLLLGGGQLEGPFHRPLEST
jgi:hypothetical protein